MYDLKEASCVAFQNLVKNVAPAGYPQCHVHQDYGTTIQEVQHSHWQ